MPRLCCSLASESSKVALAQTEISFFFCLMFICINSCAPITPGMEATLLPLSSFVDSVSIRGSEMGILSLSCYLML